MAAPSTTDAREFLEHLRWPSGPVCPRCDGRDVCRLGGKAALRGLLQCRLCRRQFTVTAGTRMHDTHLPLEVWHAAARSLAAERGQVSIRRLQRDLGIGSYRAAARVAAPYRDKETEMTEAAVAGLYLDSPGDSASAAPDPPPLVPDADPNAGSHELGQRAITEILRDIATKPGSDARLNARTALLVRIERTLRNAP